MSIQDRMQPILLELGNALIQATPEYWTEATLRVELKKRPGGVTGLAHEIKSAKHPRDIVAATDEIFLATRKLQLLCDEESQSWSALVFQIEQVGDNWKFTSDFEYA